MGQSDSSPRPLCPFGLSEPACRFLSGSLGRAVSWFPSLAAHWPCTKVDENNDKMNCITQLWLYSPPPPRPNPDYVKYNFLKEGSNLKGFFHNSKSEERE